MRFVTCRVVKERAGGAPSLEDDGHEASGSESEDAEDHDDEGEEEDDDAGFGSDMEMDEETRKELELLQAEDADFLKGMDELPTDESESEDDDLAAFDTEDEKNDGDDDEVSANTRRNQMELEDDEELESDEEEAPELETLEEDADSDEEEENAESEEEADEEEEEEKKQEMVVKEDIYGRPVVQGGDGSKAPSTYLPPHLRRKLQAEAEAAAAAAKSSGVVGPSSMDDQAIREITRRLNGQLNRISESNMESICLEIEKLYRETGRSVLNQILFEKIRQISCHPKQIMTPLIKICAALIAALFHSVGSEVGGFFIEKFVLEMVDSIKAAASAAAAVADEDDEATTSREPVNLMLFVCMLYNFGVVHCTLVYDLFRSFVDSFSAIEIELIHQLLKACGTQLRSDDADALKEMVTAVQQQVATQSAGNEGKAPDDRIRFVLDLIYELKKSSKQKKSRQGGGSMEAMDVSSLKKWLGRVKTRCGNANNALRLSLHELQNAEQDGRWWIVGGTWVGYQQNKRDDESSGPQQQIEDDENQRLIKLAEKQRMNTDVRKKIFVAIMGASDCVDAYERLLHLHLKEKQEREIVRVLLHCCGHEQKFNKYYLVLAEKLCEMDPRYKFTFQLAFWDLFKQLESFKPRKLFNLANMLSGLVMSASLSLSCLKVLDFTSLDQKSVLFLRVFFEQLFRMESELEMAQVFQRLLQTKKAQLTLDGIAVFLHQHLTSFRGEQDEKVRRLLKARSKSVKSLLDQLAKSATSSEAHESFM